MQGHELKLDLSFSGMTYRPIRAECVVVNAISVDPCSDSTELVLSKYL